MIVGETSPLHFKFMISRPVARGDYVKVKSDGRDWVLAQVEEVRRSNSAYNLAHMERQDSTRYPGNGLLRSQGSSASHIAARSSLQQARQGQGTRSWPPTIG